MIGEVLSLYKAYLINKDKEKVSQYSYVITIKYEYIRRSYFGGSLSEVKKNIFVDGINGRLLFMNNRIIGERGKDELFNKR